MTYLYIQDPAQAEPLARDLESASRLALDSEAAGFHRYSDRLCLLQVSTDRRTYVLDPLGLDSGEVFRASLEDPEVEVVMHGADFDLRLLDRDLGIHLRGLYDTQIAASLIAAEGLGLAALLEHYLDIRLPKAYQRADWAQRPLPRGMLDYAANDTHHLLALSDLLKAEVERAGRSAWVEEECRAMEDIPPASAGTEPVDPVARVKGARDLAPRQVTALRTALQWRDGLARERDRAPFRVVGDQPLVEAVLTRPRDAAGLAAIKGFPKGLARAEGRSFLRILREVDTLADDQLVAYPRSERRGPGRPPPEVEELAERLKGTRNRMAEKIGLPRGTILSNAVLLAIARERPKSLEELARVPGMRRWKVELMGEALLKIVRG